MLFYLLTSVIAQDIGYWDNAGITGAACVHLYLLPESRLVCVERPHKFPYQPNPHTGGILATEINLLDKINADGTWTAKFTPNHVQTSPFCGGHAQMADGSILHVGGDDGVWLLSNGTSISNDGHQGRRIYKPCDSGACTIGTWTDMVDMTTKRWYPTVTTLHDGSQIIVGGVTTYIDMENLSDNNNPTYEYYPSKSWCYPFCLYPVVRQLPSRNVFMMVSNKSLILNPETEKISFTIPDLIAPDHAPWIYPYTPTFVVLPLSSKNNYKYEILICGGNQQSTAATSKEASKQCWKIAPDSDNPTWNRVDDMPHGRVMSDSVILPGIHELK
jgi:hypothetical protein